MIRIPQARTAHPERRWMRLRHIILAVVLVSIALLFVIEIIRITDKTDTLKAIGAFIQSLGWPGVLVYIILFVVGSFLFVSATALSAIAPLLFGPWLGFFAILAGNLAAAVLMFGAARWMETRWAVFKRLRGKLPDGIPRLARGRGLLIIFYARLMMLPASLVNYTAPLLSVSWTEMFWGTFLAVLPHSLATALSIGMVRDALLAGSWDPLLRWEVVLLLAVYGGTLLATYRIRRRMNQA
jgi:uncharacterized membrane protein YdjX (TVP38/TMEM64 family)